MLALSNLMLNENEKLHISLSPVRIQIAILQKNI